MALNGKAPVWFWLVSALALLWNAAGVFAYFSDVMMTAEQFAALPELEQKLYAARPFWVTAAFAVSVFAGLAAAILLLMRKAKAVNLYLLSLIAVIIQFGSYFVIDGMIDYATDGRWMMSVVIAGLSLALYLFARFARSRAILS